MTLYELMKADKGHLESKDGGFVIKSEIEGFEQLMEWNGKIKNGYLKGKVACAENGDALELVWISHEKEPEVKVEEVKAEEEPKVKEEKKPKAKK